MRAVGYIRVSTIDQVEGYSLDAQERAIRETCAAKGFELIDLYRDEGVSAHTDRIDKRPALARLLRDAEGHQFDVVIVHTLDRWARNLHVALDTVRKLGKASVGFLSVTENIDYATGQGRLQLQLLGAFAEFFSESLAGHIRKARREKYELGMHNGTAPFGYRPCPCSDRGTREHEAKCAGFVVVENEANALREVGLRYAGRLTTLNEAAACLNELGMRTRKGRLFSSAGVRSLLQNPFLVGRVRYRNPATRVWEEKQGRHAPILSLSVFNQIADRKARRELPAWSSRRTYLLRGLVACVHCGASLWSEKLKSGHSYYREPRGAHGVNECPAAGTSVRCDALDQQAAELFNSVRLPGDWRSELERRVSSFERVRTVEQQRASLAERLRRLTNVYRLGNVADADYQLEQKELKSQIALLRIPEVDDAVAACELLLDLQKLWQRATVQERHELLQGMVNRVFVDLLTGRIVGVTPSPAFWSVFEAVRVDNPRVLLIKPDEVKRRLAEQQAADLVMVETGENQPPRSPIGSRIYERPPFAVVIADLQGSSGI